MDYDRLDRFTPAFYNVMQGAMSRSERKQSKKKRKGRLFWRKKE